VVIALLIDHTQVFQLVADAFRLDAFDNHFQIVAVGKVEPIIQGKEHAVFVGVSEIQQRNFDGMNIEYFKIENQSRKELSPHLFLFSILDNENYGKSINLNQIFENESRIFVITKEFTQQLLNKLSSEDFYKDSISYSETAGTQLLQFKKDLNKWDVLNNYYKDNARI